MRDASQCDPNAKAADPHTQDPGDTAKVDVDGAIDLASVLAPAMSDDELGWLGQYRVLRVLGRGGMGLVLEAEDTHLLRKVALKIILPDYAGGQEARERFLREARSGAAIKNDHVVTVYQVGQHNDIPYLALELLHGETLQDRLLRFEPVSSAETIRIGSEIAQGLMAAHAQGLIHRDIKPANIWLEEPGGRVKLLDFGLARVVGSTQALTRAGKIVGTPEYMSPEQAMGEPIDPRTDLFSLGAVLYTVCTGFRPFRGNGVVATLKEVMTAEPTPLCELVPDAPPALASLIARLLAKDRNKRPQSAEEVHREFQAIARAIEPAPAPKQCAAEPVRRSRWPRKTVFGALVGVVALIALTVLAVSWSTSRPQAATVPSGPPIRIGILHSRTGTMSVSERPIIEAVQLAVDELNERGVLGRQIDIVIADGQSEESRFASQAERLINEEKVCAIFGCWTSDSRKAVLPIVERNDHVLFYPAQYEGMEQSSNIVYCGPVPNQQILPALRWLVDYDGRHRWYLVGTDTIFPRTVNAVIRDEADARGCQIVGESYALPGCLDVEDIVKQIVKAKPSLIVSTVNGDTNTAFFRALRAGVKSKDVPTLSLSLSGDELGQLDPSAIAGDYVAANYFQSLKLPKNKEFVVRCGKHFDRERSISSGMETAYNAVYLWAKAVEAAGSEAPASVRRAIRNQQLDAPQGPVRVDPATLHLVQTPRVAKINADGRLDEVYHCPQPVSPEPFPASRTRAEWEAVVNALHKGWGGRWSNSGS